MPACERKEDGLHRRDEIKAGLQEELPKSEQLVPFDRLDVPSRLDVFGMCSSSNHRAKLAIHKLGDLDVGKCERTSNLPCSALNLNLITFLRC